jgi:septin 7
LDIDVIRWKPILDNIEARYDAYLEQENRVNRTKMVDNRVHACLYFIEPTGHSYVPLVLPLRENVMMLTCDDRLKPVDIESMRRLHNKVNLIPVIAKADTMTDDEVAAFKARILADIAHHGIQIFQTPQYEREDEETMAENAEIIVSSQPLFFFLPVSRSTRKIKLIIFGWVARLA